MTKVIKIGMRKRSQAEIENVLEYSQDLMSQLQGLESMIKPLGLPKMISTEAGEAIRRLRNINTMLQIQL